MAFRRDCSRRDAKLIFQAYEELEVGGVIAGDVPTFRVEHMLMVASKIPDWDAKACATQSRR